MSKKGCTCTHQKDGEILHLMECPNEDQTYTWEILVDGEWVSE
ncbi:MAG: hypothetical protein OR994_07755 [Candidatus Poseidoniales archaeon]|nr:hypothetical protein [Candidatus Poseidoniales archaeon]